MPTIVKLEIQWEIEINFKRDKIIRVLSFAADVRNKQTKRLNITLIYLKDKIHTEITIKLFNRIKFTITLDGLKPFYCDVY